MVGAAGIVGGAEVGPGTGVLGTSMKPGGVAVGAGGCVGGAEVAVGGGGEVRVGAGAGVRVGAGGWVGAGAAVDVAGGSGVGAKVGWSLAGAAVGVDRPAGAWLVGVKAESAPDGRSLEPAGEAPDEPPGAVGATMAGAGAGGTVRVGAGRVGVGDGAGVGSSVGTGVSVGSGEAVGATARAVALGRAEGAKMGSVGKGAPGMTLMMSSRIWVRVSSPARAIVVTEPTIRTRVKMAARARGRNAGRGQRQWRAAGTG